MGKRWSRSGKILVSFASVILLWLALTEYFEVALLRLERPTGSTRDKNATSALVELDDIPLDSPQKPLILESDEQLHKVGWAGNLTSPTPNITSSAAPAVLRPQSSKVLGPHVDNSASSNSVIVHKDSTRQKPVNIDLVVGFGGELGNHLLKIANGKILQLMAREDGRFRFTLRYLSQGNPTKSDKSRQQVQQCFDKYFSPDRANLKEWVSSSQKWITMRDHQIQFVRQFYTDMKNPFLAAQETLTLKADKEDSIKSSFDRLADLIQRLQSKGYSVGKAPHGPHDPFHLHYRPLDNLSIPFVMMYSLANVALMDRYFDEIYKMFAFNETRCCSARPDADETVLHFRGFEIEFQKNITEKRPIHRGHRELDPNRTAYELLGHLNRGDKVAILSRFGEEHMQPYIDPLKERGLQVRAVTGQNDVQDFCFLKSSTKEMVGVHISTFFLTAALLSDTVLNVTRYHMEIPGYNKIIYIGPLVNDRLKKKTFVHRAFSEHAPSG